MVYISVRATEARMTRKKAGQTVFTYNDDNDGGGA
jgi:hypothetical protein